MSAYLPQTIDNERERWASNISAALRSLRKYGFFVVQEPLSAALPEADQQRQAREAACHILGVPATNENLSTHAVHELSRTLIEGGSAGLNRIRGPHGDKMTKDNDNGLADELAGRLMKLHRDLEDRGDKGTDWSLARALEDRIGAYQQITGDSDRAERLLKKHGF